MKRVAKTATKSRVVGAAMGLLALLLLSSPLDTPTHPLTPAPTLPPPSLFLTPHTRCLQGCLCLPHSLPEENKHRIKNKEKRKEGEDVSSCETRSHSPEDRN